MGLQEIYLYIIMLCTHYIQYTLLNCFGRYKSQTILDEPVRCHADAVRQSRAWPTDAWYDVVIVVAKT